MKILDNTQCKKFVDLAVKRLANYLVENKLSGVTTGISGGIDSAVTAIIGLKTVEYLVKKNYQADFQFLFIDCESNPPDYQKADALARLFNFKLKRVDLSSWYQSSPLLTLINKNNQNYKTARGNIKARLRMILLYQTALLNNYIYLDTGDLSEHWMGFWTRHGDEGDIKIIDNLTKTETYDLGEYLNLPSIILNSSPGDGLKITRKSLASDQLGLDFIYIEYIISRFITAGFEINGSQNQLIKKKYHLWLNKISGEIKKTRKSIDKIVVRCLKTNYKRKFGDYAYHLIPNRNQIGLPEPGKKEFNEKYLKAIMSRLMI